LDLGGDAAPGPGVPQNNGPEEGQDVWDVPVENVAGFEVKVESVLLAKEGEDCLDVVLAFLQVMRGRIVLDAGTLPPNGPTAPITTKNARETWWLLWGARQQQPLDGAGHRALYRSEDFQEIDKCHAVAQVLDEVIDKQATICNSATEEQGGSGVAWGAKMARRAHASATYLPSAS
jgi:hypothetical protein